MDETNGRQQREKDEVSNHFSDASGSKATTLTVVVGDPSLANRGEAVAAWVANVASCSFPEVLLSTTDFTVNEELIQEAAAMVEDAVLLVETTPNTASQPSRSMIQQQHLHQNRSSSSEDEPEVSTGAALRGSVASNPPQAVWEDVTEIAKECGLISDEDELLLPILDLGDSDNGTDDERAAREALSMQRNIDPNERAAFFRNEMDTILGMTLHTNEDNKLAASHSHTLVSLIESCDGVQVPLVPRVPAHRYIVPLVGSDCSKTPRALKAAQAFIVLKQFNPSCVASDEEEGRSEFRREYIETSQPVIVTGIPALRAWRAWCGNEGSVVNNESEGLWTSIDNLCNSSRRSVPVQVASVPPEFEGGLPRPVRIPIDMFVGYATSTSADYPHYCFEPDLALSSERGVLRADFEVPPIFAEDLFNTSPAARLFYTHYRYLVMGGPRTGSHLHQDPKGTSAWNTLLCGKKRWVLFPPVIAASSIGADEFAQNTSPMQWWIDFYPKLLSQPEAAKNLGMIECVQEPGDTIFVPAGWWHAVLNTEFTLAVTQNFFPPANLRYSIPRLAAEWPEFIGEFLDGVRLARQDVHESLLAEGIVVDNAPEPDDHDR